MKVEEAAELTQTYYCLDCAVCTGSCPVSRYQPTFSPRLIVEKALLGLGDELLKDRELWSCLTCSRCFQRCPTSINFPEFMRLLRVEAMQAGTKPVYSHHGMLQTIMELQTQGIRVYEVDRKELDLTRDATPGRLVFCVSYPGQYRVEKIYTFNPDRYAFDLEVRFQNNTNVALSQNLSMKWYKELDKKGIEEEGAIAQVKDSTEREAGPKLEKKAYGPDVRWGGFENKFFIGAMIPKQPALTSASFAKDARGQVVVNLEGPKNTIPPGQAGVFNYTLYVGPKEYDRLKAEGVGLETAINVGSWMKWLAFPFLILMQFLYTYVGNYGWVIIIITVLTKIIFWPLGNKSYKSMKEMQKVQPKLTEIKERYKEDKQKMNAAVMELYKTHKINPLRYLISVYRTVRLS